MGKKKNKNQYAADVDSSAGDAGNESHNSPPPAVTDGADETPAAPPARAEKKTGTGNKSYENHAKFQKFKKENSK